MRVFLVILITFMIFTLTLFITPADRQLVLLIGIVSLLHLIALFLAEITDKLEKK